MQLILPTKSFSQKIKIRMLMKESVAFHNGKDKVDIPGKRKKNTRIGLGISVAKADNSYFHLLSA